MNFITKAFKKNKSKGWNKIFICVDLHEVIITPTYSRLNDGAEIYPHARAVLQRWTEREDVCLILWTCSHDNALRDIRDRLANEGILFDYVNENPEVPSSDICDFSGKFYMDIGLDDKFGFDAANDWLAIKRDLKRSGAW